MTDFFNKADLSRNDAEKIISETLNNCDDGELYLENSKSESIVLDDGKIKNSTYSSDLGYGLRAVTGEVVAYSHSNEISKNSLKQSADNLSSTLKSRKGIYNHEIPKTNEQFYKNINPIEEKTLQSKLDLLKEVNNYTRKKVVLFCLLSSTVLYCVHIDLQTTRARVRLASLAPSPRVKAATPLQYPGRLLFE